MKGRKVMAQKIVYNHKAIEKKWRENWEKNPVNVQYDEDGNKKQKYYYEQYRNKLVFHVGHILCCLEYSVLYNMLSSLSITAMLTNGHSAAGRSKKALRYRTQGFCRFDIRPYQSCF